MRTSVQEATVVVPLASPAGEVISVWMKAERGGKKFVASADGETLEAAVLVAKTELASLMKE